MSIIPATSYEAFQKAIFASLESSDAFYDSNLFRGWLAARGFDFDAESWELEDYWSDMQKALVFANEDAFEEGIIVYAESHGLSADDVSQCRGPHNRFSVGDCKFFILEREDGVLFVIPE